MKAVYSAFTENSDGNSMRTQTTHAVVNLYIFEVIKRAARKLQQKHQNHGRFFTEKFGISW